ncbi:hypothetical protein CGCF413_v013441 [Colletotrichum fructicola]|nr:hypothetical protein CGCF413_v013441 [Colletotrichum fructicola]
MTACGILVVGGITAGLIVGERIPGVDPFNIATFAWVLAAFIILIAKSLSVREWPWRDFLRGQVPCRSVSELHTVTGIDEQRILKYLLASVLKHTETKSFGPSEGCKSNLMKWYQTGEQ